jgi:hypothetical protein
VLHISSCVNNLYHLHNCIPSSVVYDEYNVLYFIAREIESGTSDARVGAYQWYASKCFISQLSKDRNPVLWWRLTSVV